MAITVNLRYETRDTRRYSITIENTGTVYTTVTTSHFVANRWVHTTVANFPQHYNIGELIIGVSIQFAPSSGNGVATLQLSTGTRCLIFHLCHTSYTPTALRRFLFDSHVTFVSLDDNLDIIRRLWGSPQRLRFLYMPVNLRSHVGRRDGENIENYSVPRIAREVLAVLVDETDMDSRYSYWGVDQLSIGQIRHATLGASVASWLGWRIQAWIYRH